MPVPLPLHVSPAMLATLLDQSLAACQTAQMPQLPSLLLLKLKGFLSLSPAFSDGTETRLQSYNLYENWFLA